MTKSVYMDHNATTHMFPTVKQKMIETLNTPLNPSSVHSFGRNAKGMLEDARYDIARNLNINLKTHQIIFTSSGTEANNWILKQFYDDPIIISTIEHLSIYEHHNHCNINFVQVNKNGIVDLENLEKQLHAQGFQEKRLVSIMLANNETGIIQPIEDIVKISKKYGALIHSDCVQGVGKIPFDFSKFKLDFATISAHKCGGPLGIAALIARKDFLLLPEIIGGGQERGFRAGTENVVAAVGFAEAVKCSYSRVSKLHLMRDNMEKSIKDHCRKATVIGENAERLPNTSMIIMPGVDAQTQLINLDLEGFAVSSGSACSSGKIDISRVLLAMNFAVSEARNAIRISLGWNQGQREVSAFVRAWLQVYHSYLRKEQAS